MVARRHRRELFPPDRGLQARMVVAAVVTPTLVLALFVAIMVVMPLRFAGPVAVAAVLGVFVALAARRASDQTRVLGPHEAPELHAAVERLCLLGDLPVPQLVLEPERQPNSWLVAPPRRPPRLHVTEGLLRTLTPVELEAVIGHELAHLANRDALVMTVVGGPASVLVEGGRHVSGLYFAGVFVGGWIARAIGELGGLGTSALSRYRELAADAGAAALTGHPAALASALVKVSGGIERMPREDLRAVAARDAFHLLPTADEADQPLGRLRSTHPALEQRLAHLERLERRMATARPAPVD